MTSTAANPLRAVIYVRISVDRDEQSSTDSQERVARDYATARGWTTVAVETDRGRSAFKEDGAARRPGLDRALQLIESGAADTLIVWKLDRFVRSVAGFGKLWQRLEKAGGSFVSVTDAFDTTTAMGRAMLQIAVVFAELESGIKSERIGAWHEERTLAGAAPTGPRPFGYRRPEHGGLEIVHAEAAEIRNMANRVLAGESLSAVTRDLNSRLIPTASTVGTVWRNGTVRRVLTSTTTAGLREVDGVYREGTWESILNRATWDQLREVLLDPARKTMTTNQPRHLLTARLTCSKCGSMMRPRKHPNGPRYGCKGDGCAISVPVDRTDEVVVSAVLALIDRDAWRQLKSARSAPGVDLDALEDELAQLADLYGRGEITIAEWQVARRGLTDRTATASSTPADLPDADDLASAWEGFTLQARQLVLDAVIKSITVAPGRRGARGFDPNRLSIEWAV